MAKMMHLGKLLFGTGSHLGGWRMPDAQFGSQNFALLQHAARVAERGKLDFVFFADSVNTNLEMHPGMIVRLEPLTLLGALSVTTSRVGLIATVSTTFSQPYNVARALSSLDHLSGGRIGWNVVTSYSPEAAANFGMDQLPSRAERYDIAREYVQVVKALWESWDEGALVGDKAAGRYVDPDKMHVLNHKGAHFSVRGPLNITRSPQVHPVIVQAGASDTGIEFAGATGELIFTQQQIPEQAIAFTNRLRDVAEASGRSRDSLRVVCGVCPIIGRSREDAQAMIARLGELLDPKVAMRLLSTRLGQEMSGYPLDEPVPDLPPPNSADGMHGHYKQLLAIARREKLTLRQLRDYAAASTGHRLVAGTPVEIADDLESWFESGACDGFMVMSPYEPGPTEQFVDEVVPILVKRGLFRAEYEGTSLRDHLGLPPPVTGVGGAAGQ